MTDQDRIRLAELEAANARAGRDHAELQRDAVADVAVNEAVNRAVAENVASDARARATQAESRERTMATSAGLARQDASYERAAASNATFSATLIGIVAVALVLAVVGYFAWWQPNHAVSASTNTFIRTDKTTEKSAPASTVIVKQPDVNVKVVVPASTPPTEDKPAAADTPSADADHSAAPATDGDNAKTPETKPGTDNP